MWRLPPAPVVTPPPLLLPSFPEAVSPASLPRARTAASLHPPAAQHMHRGVGPGSKGPVFCLCACVSRPISWRVDTCAEAAGPAPSKPVLMPLCMCQPTTHYHAPPEKRISLQFVFLDHASEGTYLVLPSFPLLPVPSYPVLPLPPPPSSVAPFLEPGLLLLPMHPPCSNTTSLVHPFSGSCPSLFANSFPL